MKLLILILSLINFCNGRDIEREMTVEVAPGGEQCFYEMVKAGETLDIEYQVS